MATEPNFEAGAPMDSLNAPIPQADMPAPEAPEAPRKKLVDVYTAMLFVAAIMLIVGGIALAMEKSRYGDLWGNTWQIPPDVKISAVTQPGDFDHSRSLYA